MPPSYPAKASRCLGSLRTPARQDEAAREAPASSEGVFQARRACKPKTTMKTIYKGAPQPRWFGWSAAPLTLSDWRGGQLACGSNEVLGVEADGTQPPLGQPGLGGRRQPERRILVQVLIVLILVHAEVLQQDAVQGHAGLGEQRQLLRTMIPAEERWF